MVVALQPFYFPALAISAAYVLVRCFFVVEGELRRVPLERGLRKTHGDAAEQHRFGERTRVVEIRAWLAVVHARFGPLGPMMTLLRPGPGEILELLERLQLGGGTVR